MPHAFRFYVPPETDATDTITLTPEEAHHALHVARIRVGDSVTLFDGCGREWDGRITHSPRREAVVAVEHQRTYPTPARRLTLAQAWIKRDKAIESIIQRGTELGVSRFCFFPSQHSERKPQGDDKWLRYAIESCKQCGRAWLPAFEAADGLNTALERQDGAVLLATKDETPVPWSEAVRGNDLTLLVGPEGDFTGEERALAISRGAKPVSFGPVTYRSEAAAVLGATLILHAMGEFGE